MPSSAAGRRTAKLSSPAPSEMIGIFAARNPATSRADIEAIGELVAEFGATAANLSPAARSRLVAHKAEFRNLIDAIVAEAEEGSRPRIGRKGFSGDRPGDGLGPVISAAEGGKRLAAYATPSKVEAWAGALAGPKQLEREYGVARSTLHAWQRQGAVIGLLVGVRKHAFPIEQFIDGRPLAGLKPVVDVVGECRTAWLWLREPNPGLAGATPLACLRSGRVDDVVEAARSNFDRR